MGQNNPAQSILDLRDKFVNTMKKVSTQDKPASKAPVDTSWHDQMVKQANDSFRKQAEQKKAQQKKVSTPSTGSTTPQKSVNKKTVTRKKISTK